MAYVIWIVYNQWGISILFLALAFIVATRKIEILIVTRRLKAIRRVFPYPVLLFISIYSIVISSSLHSYSRLVLKHAKNDGKWLSLFGNFVSLFSYTGMNYNIAKKTFYFSLWLSKRKWRSELSTLPPTKQMETVIR